MLSPRLARSDSHRASPDTPPRRCEIRRRRRFPPIPTERGPRRNKQIRISPIRVVGVDGSQIGIIETYLAIQMAQEQGLDLVEVSPDTRPPVCKLMDFGRHKYDQSRAERERKKKQTDNTPKEVRFRPTTDTHDMDVKIKHASEFLSSGHKVKLTVRFRGREMRRQDVGRETLRVATDRLKEFGKLDSSIPEMQGRMISVTMSALATKGKAVQVTEKVVAPLKKSKSKAAASALAKKEAVGAAAIAEAKLEAEAKAKAYRAANAAANAVDGESPDDPDDPGDDDDDDDDDDEDDWDAGGDVPDGLESDDDDDDDDSDDGESDDGDSDDGDSDDGDDDGGDDEKEE